MPLHPSNKHSFKEMLQRWQAVDNTVFNLKSLRFESQTSRSRDECVTAQLTHRSRKKHIKTSNDRNR